MIDVPNFTMRNCRVVGMRASCLYSCMPFAVKNILCLKRPNLYFANKAYTTQTWKDDATLYIHWPYCEKRCTYCNFNKYISKTVNHDRMRKCLVQELQYLLKLSQVKEIKSVFFGGGTPSLAEPVTIQAVLDTAREYAFTAPDIEVTMEMNPTDAEASKLRYFKDAGINRVSLGLQALNNQDLQLFGRNHNIEEGLRALNLCKDLFPGRTSIDVIFGRPGQSIKTWKDELQKLVSLADGHISLYQLTLERGTALFKMVMDRKVMMPSIDIMAELYDITVESLENAGFNRYEVSNFAKNTETESKHNKAYWNGSQYIGIGPGAHGRFIPASTDLTDRQSRIQTLEPENWMREVERHGHGTRKITTQTRAAVLEELLITSLRTVDGLTQQRWCEFAADTSLMDVFSDKYMVKTFTSEQFLILDDRGLRTTSKGMNVVDSLLPDLINIIGSHFGEET